MSRSRLNDEQLVVIWVAGLVCAFLFSFPPRSRYMSSLEIYRWWRFVVPGLFIAGLALFTYAQRYDTRKVKKSAFVRRIVIALVVLFASVVFAIMKGLGY